MGTPLGSCGNFGVVLASRISHCPHPTTVGTSVPLSLFSGVLSIVPFGDKRNGTRRGFSFLSDLLVDSLLFTHHLAPRSDANLLM